MIKNPVRAKKIFFNIFFINYFEQSKVMGIMFGGFDRMGEGESKKMQKLVLNRAKTNQIDRNCDVLPIDILV